MLRLTFGRSIEITTGRAVLLSAIQVVDSPTGRESRSTLEMTMAVTIGFQLSYGQLSVFASALKDPYNDWTDQHISQGFTWRPGSVSFSSMVGSVDTRSISMW